MRTSAVPQYGMAETKIVELFPFSHYDAVRRKWIRARYRATLAELRKRYGEKFEITGEPERRQVAAIPSVGLYDHPS